MMPSSSQEEHIQHTTTSPSSRTTNPQNSSYIRNCCRRKREKSKGPLAYGPTGDHLAKFIRLTMQKEMWDASNLDLWNDESQKMQKYILNTGLKDSLYPTQRLHKVYDSGHDLNENEKFYMGTGRSYNLMQRGCGLIKPSRMLYCHKIGHFAESVDSWELKITGGGIIDEILETRDGS
ncbi:hypothetical protein Tco_0597627 [Tanacetum coccineum]